MWENSKCALNKHITSSSSVHPLRRCTPCNPQPVHLPFSCDWNGADGPGPFPRSSSCSLQPLPPPPVHSYPSAPRPYATCDHVRDYSANPLSCFPSRLTPCLTKRSLHLLPTTLPTGPPSTHTRGSTQCTRPAYSRPAWRTACSCATAVKGSTASLKDIFSCTDNSTASNRLLSAGQPSMVYAHTLQMSLHWS